MRTPLLSFPRDMHGHWPFRRAVSPTVNELMIIKLAYGLVPSDVMDSVRKTLLNDGYRRMSPKAP